MGETSLPWLWGIWLGMVNSRTGVWGLTGVNEGVLVLGGGPLRMLCLGGLGFRFS